MLESDLPTCSRHLTAPRPTEAGGFLPQAPRANPRKLLGFNSQGRVLALHFPVPECRAYSGESYSSDLLPGGPGGPRSHVAAFQQSPRGQISVTVAHQSYSMKGVIKAGNLVQFLDRFAIKAAGCSGDPEIPAGPSTLSTPRRSDP